MPDAFQTLQLQMEQLLQRQQQQQPDEQPRVIGDIDSLHAFYQILSAICPPAIQRQDYKIKPQMIALVRQHIFNGMPSENSMDHIETFEEMCSTNKANGIPLNFLKCKLFPFTLADKAHRWLKSLLAESITSWKMCRSTFIDHFYTKKKIAVLRNKITKFRQHPREAFCETWEWYVEYRRDCPHHGYSDGQLLGCFTNEGYWDYKIALNASSNGNFMTKIVQEAYELIENLAASYSESALEYDISRKANSVLSQKNR